MNNIILPMTALPNLTNSIKRTIALSLWSLFQVNSNVVNALYLLKTPEQSFLLDKDGKVLKIQEASDDITEISRVFFEGFSFPTEVKLNSISNTVCI